MADRIVIEHRRGCVVRIALAILVVLVFTAAPDAHAVTFPGQRVAPRAIQELVNGWAHPFWAARNVSACDGPITVWVADNLPGEQGGGALGLGGNCEVYIDSDIASTVADARAARAGKRLSHRARKTLRGWLLGTCTVAYHETGHALGLPHSETGVMGATISEHLLDWAPYECRLWARTQMPR